MGDASDVSIQPGGRDPAPGQLALVQAFLNTFYDLAPGRHGSEVLHSPRALGSWLADRGLLSPGAALRRADLERVLAFRAALRELLRLGGDGAGAEAGLERVNALARGAAVEVRLGRRGARFLSADDASVNGAVGVLVAIVATAMSDGGWARMKICPGHECGWAFYDHSRNQSGRWCSMSVCGGREKARAHYRRRRGD